MINPDGSGEEKLVDIDGHAQELNWSNDGNKLAFVVTNTTNMASADLSRNVYLYRIPNSDLRQLTTDSQNAVPTYYDPHFSPDGAMIAVRVRGPHSSIVKVLSETGAGLQTISSNLFPAVPDSPGKIPVYALFVDFVGWIDSQRMVLSMRANNGYVSLWEFNLATKQTKKIYSEFLNGGFIEINPVLSPDGTKITYVSGTNVQNIWVCNATDGSEKRKITDQPEDSPIGISYSKLQFSPDGSKVLSVLSSSVDSGGSIVSINTETGGEKVLTSWYELRGLDWGNSKEIVFVDLSKSKTDPAVPTGDLWKLNIETLEKQKLTTNASQPAWSPK